MKKDVPVVGEYWGEDGEYWGEVAATGPDEVATAEPAMGTLPSGAAVVVDRGTAGTGGPLMIWFKPLTREAGATTTDPDEEVGAF